jgi:hypothetical protein
MSEETKANSNSADDFSYLWSWAQHEDILFDSRFEKFATVHAILIGAAALVLQRTSAATFFVYGVSILGIVLSLLWLFVLNRSRRLLASLEGEINARQPLYGRHIKRGSFSQTKLMCVVPVLVAAFWTFLLVAAARSWLG